MANLLKYAVVTVLFTIAIICIFSEPVVGVPFSLETFFISFTLTKLAGLFVAYCTYRLIMRWNLFDARNIEDVA